MMAEAPLILEAGMSGYMCLTLCVGMVCTTIITVAAIVARVEARRIKNG